jgi:ABC-type branched-subunit amino acid transport system substrate-binding protein
MPAGTCAPLASDDCAVLAEKSDLENDATVFIGAMFPTSGDEGRAYGKSNRQAVDLARRDFAETIGRFAQTDHSIRPIAVVACDDVGNATRVAEHLVNDVGVAGVIGFRNSTEIVDLAASIFIPHRVVAMAALNTGAAVTAVPQPNGEPRLVWRTTYNLNTTAAPLAAFVHDVLEPRVLASTRAPIRVAFVRPKTTAAVSFSAELLRSLSFNGMSATANRDTYLEVTFVDPSEPSPPNWKEALDQLRTFAPHVVLFLGDDTLVKNLIEPLEASSPTPRPIYATMHNLAPSLFAFVGKDASRRRRFFGMTSVSTIDTNAKFVTHYNETFADKITRTIAPNTAYDAFYMLAYAVHALGATAVNGPNLARAFARLESGKATDVGPADIFDAYKALAAGKSIDLQGSIGKLDFDADTGEAPVDMTILCVNMDRDGRAFDTLESGLVFDAATKKLGGTMRCP